jgi:outer membrane protein assembly factor BamB
MSKPLHYLGTAALTLSVTIAMAQLSPSHGQTAASAAAAPTDPLRNTIPAIDGDWLMFNHDQQRTGWNNSETILTKKNVSQLKLLWSSQLSTPVVVTTLQTLTAPLAATVDGRMLVYVMGADDTLFAVDATDGKIVWQKTFKNTLMPQRAATWLCANAEQATPVIDKVKGVIYFTTSDGNLRAAMLSDGSEKQTPAPFMAPFSRNWSLNLIGNFVYSTAGRGCGGDAAHPVEAGNIAAADISDPSHVVVEHVFTGTGRPAGPWSRSGVALGPQGVYVQTADGPADSASGFYGSSVIAIRPGGRGVADSFLPPNWRYLNAKDLDLGSGSPTLFPFKGHALIATGAKEGLVYLLDANALGGGTPEHSKALYTTPRFGNDAVKLDGWGIWGGFSTWESTAGARYVYFQTWNKQAQDTADSFKYKNGDTSQGSVMALQVIQDGAKFSLAPAWVTGINQAPDVPVVANGVVYAVGTGEQTIQNPEGQHLDLNQGAVFRATPVGHQVLYALDAETGQVLYNSKTILKDWDHFVEPVVSHGKVFVVSHDAHLYAFGLK